MKQSLFASLTLMAAPTLALSIGSAIVQNLCPFEVYLANTPAGNGGYETQSTILVPGQVWSTIYTELTNEQGWAIKMAPSEAELAHPLQYEYTFHNDGNIWYDLSEVDGHPFPGDWKLFSDSPGCYPNQTAYQYSDDNKAEQWCPQDALITAILCPGQVQSSSSSSVISSSAWSTSSLVAPSTVASSTASPISSSSKLSVATPASSQASPTASTSVTWTVIHSSFSHPHGGYQAAYEEPTSTTITSPTTFAISTTAAIEEAPGETVWEIETAIVTNVVTAVVTAPSRIKRHEHHAGHQHVI